MLQLEMMLDYKACAYIHNECSTGTHMGPRVKRMLVPEGSFVLAISVPSSSLSVKQVFSRPLLTAKQLIHLDQQESAYQRLLTYKFEPRVWKVLFELFPGPSVLALSRPAPGEFRADSVPQGTAPAASYEMPRTQEEVTDDPITSPGQSGMGTFQTNLRVDPTSPPVGSRLFPSNAKLVMNHKTIPNDPPPPTYFLGTMLVRVPIRRIEEVNPLLRHRSRIGPLAKTGLQLFKLSCREFLNWSSRQKQMLSYKCKRTSLWLRSLVLSPQRMHPLSESYREPRKIFWLCRASLTGLLPTFFPVGE